MRGFKSKSVGMVLSLASLTSNAFAYYYDGGTELTDESVKCNIFIRQAENAIGTYNQYLDCRDAGDESKCPSTTKYIDGKPQTKLVPESQMENDLLNNIGGYALTPDCVNDPVANDKMEKVLANLRRPPSILESYIETINLAVLTNPLQNRVKKSESPEPQDNSGGIPDNGSAYNTPSYEGAEVGAYPVAETGGGSCDVNYVSYGNGSNQCFVNGSGHEVENMDACRDIAQSAGC